VQIAETFKMIREILTQQIVPRQTACSSTTFSLFLSGAKWITIISLVRFLKKRCLNCIFASKPESF